MHRFQADEPEAGPQMTCQPSPGRGRKPRRALLGAVLAMLACGGYDGDSTFVVVVRVEPTVEEATAFPAQVLVGFDSTGSGFVVFRLGFLCAPPAEPFVVTASFAETGAERPSEIEAWVVPLDSGAPPACGALQVPEPVGSSLPRTGASARGEVAVFAGCGSGDAESLTLVVDGIPSRSPDLPDSRTRARDR